MRALLIDRRKSTFHTKDRTFNARQFYGGETQTDEDRTPDAGDTRRFVAQKRATCMRRSAKGTDFITDVEDGLGELVARETTVESALRGWS